MGAFLGILFCMFVGMCIAGLIILFLTFFEDEIEFQWFYFKLFLFFTFMAFRWICCFGTRSMFIMWKYNSDEWNEVIIPEIDLW